MYNLMYKQKPAIYIWDFKNQKVYKQFEKRNDFIHFVACRFYTRMTVDRVSQNFITKEFNLFLDKCVCNDNDIYNTSKFVTYQIFDEYNHCLVPTDIWNEAYPIWEKYYKNNVAAANKQKAKWNVLYKRSYQQLPNFRKGPVPNIHKRARCKISCRHPHTTAMKRYCCANEQQNYNRGSWKNLPSSYDDIWRIEQKNWKSQSKRRHQWKFKK